MSTTTVYISRAQRRVARRELRAQQRAAREAALRRERARWKAEQEAAQRTAALAKQEARYQELVARLDVAHDELPDLAFSLPAFPTSAELEDVRRWVDQHNAMADKAIVLSREILEERRRREAAWRDLHEVRDAFAVQIDICRQLAAQARAGFEPPSMPDLPDAESPSERIRGESDAVVRRIAGLQKVREDLGNRALTRSNARAQTGAAATEAGAARRINAWAAAQEERSGTVVRKRIEEALHRHDLDLAELPTALRDLAAYVTENALDPLPILDWLARHRTRLGEREKARTLLVMPPEFLDAPELLHRWTDLIRRLEAVINGLLPWEPLLEETWRQLHKDSQVAVTHAFAQARLREAAHENGFKVTDDSEAGVEVMELEAFPDYWVELTEREIDEGVFATVAELHAGTSADESCDAAATAAACAALQRMAGDNETLTAVVEEVERNTRVRRAERPRRRVMAKPLDGE